LYTHIIARSLGSDPVRELLAYRRVIEGDPNPVLLLRPNPKLLAARNAKALLGASPEIKNILNEMMESE
jgi:hypothetical protein